MSGPPPKPLRIIVIGANPQGRGGEWAKRILSLSTTWTLCGTVDPALITRQYWDQHGIPSFAELTIALKTLQPDAAVIAVPPSFTADLQATCARHGVAIMAEKPLATSLPELARLQQCYRQNPVPVVVGVQRRSHPTYRYLREILQTQSIPPSELAIHIALGRPAGQAPDGHRANLAEAGGGNLLDLGYHALDLAQFILDQPLETISCTLTTNDDLTPSLESDAQLLARAGTTWIRLHIKRHGQKSELVQALTADGLWSANREQVIAPTSIVAFTSDRSWDQAETGRLEALAQRIRAGTQTPPDLWNHLAILELVERSYATARILGLETSPHTK